MVIEDSVIKTEEKYLKLEEKVVNVRRCTKVVKGGRNFKFSVLVILGDKNGSIGLGLGRAREVVDAVKKGRLIAKKNMLKISLNKNTISYFVEARFKGSRVIIKPARVGTGIIAGSGARMVLELLGVKDVLSKIFGSNNPINVVKATIEAVKLLR